MKRLLLPLLFGLALPTVVNAGVDPAVHNLCKDVSDYMGCVKANSKKEGWNPFKKTAKEKTKSKSSLKPEIKRNKPILSTKGPKGSIKPLGEGWYFLEQECQDPSSNWKPYRCAPGTNHSQYHASWDWIKIVRRTDTYVNGRRINQAIVYLKNTNTIFTRPTAWDTINKYMGKEPKPPLSDKELDKKWFTTTFYFDCTNYLLKTNSDWLQIQPGTSGIIMADWACAADPF